MKLYRSLLLTLALLFALGACSEKRPAEAEKTVQPSPPAPLVISPLSQPAGLRDVLPVTALAYLRLPNPWGLLSAPKGNSLGKALGDSRNLASIRALHQGVSRQLLQGKEVLPDPVLDLFLMQLRSPLELAVLSSDDSQPLAATVLVKAVIAPATVTELNIWLNLLATQQPALSVVSPVSAAGRGQLLINGVPVFLQFDTATQALMLQGGLTVTEALFDATLASLTPQTGHPMYGQEAEIDTSRQGLFCWVNTARVIPLIKPTLTPDQLHELEASRLDQVKAVAMGWGVRDGKGRMRLSAETSDSVLQQRLGGFDNQWTLTTAGRPHAMLTASLPSADQFLAIEQQLLDSMPVSSSIQYRQFSQALEQAWGFPGTDWLRALGNEAVVFADDVGEYLAVEIRDGARLDQLLLTLTTQTALEYGVHKVNGVDIHHMLLPSMLMQGNAEALEKMPPLLRKLVLASKSHLYWVREGNYLVFAGVPQLLLDRAAHTQRTELGVWLREQQRQPGDQALLLVSAGIDQAPRRVYYAYLQILSYLADLSGTQLDIYNLPTARDLGLPARGAFGAQLDVGPERLALELTFESTPAELFMDPGSGGVVAVAMVGVMAAVAIPAYHDYTLRAQVAGGIAEAATAKSVVSEFYAQAGRFPTAEEIVLLGLAPGHTVKLSLVPETGVVVITYAGGRELDGKRVAWIPKAIGQGLEWACKSDLDGRYLPAACR